MKVYIVTKEPFPNGMAAVKRIVCYAKALIRQGVGCEVLVYTRTEVYGKQPKNTVGKGVYDGVSYRYMKGTPLRESNVVIRRINDYMDRLRLKRYLMENLKPGDAVFAYNSCDSYSLDILKIAHLQGAGYAQELCELPFGTSEETPKLLKKRRMFEQRLMPQLDGMIAISDTLADYAREHCSDKAEIVKVPILIDFPKYEMSDRSGDADIPYIFHSGTLFQQKDGFLDMLRAFATVSERLPYEIRFISTGKPEGTRHEKEINAILDKRNLRDKVVFTGYLNEGELRDYLQKATFVVINKLTTRQNKYCFSTKLGEYMAAQKAIVITKVGEAMNFLTNRHDALIIPPNNVEALADAMECMFNDKQLRQTLGNNAQQTCKNKFNIDSNSMIIKKLMSVIGGG